MELKSSAHWKGSRMPMGIGSMQMQRTILLAMLLLPSTVTIHGRQNPEEAGYIDTHMHLSGQAARSTSGWESAGAALVSLMDRGGVAISLIMPPPQRPNMRGAATFEDLLPAVRKYPGRLALVAGGGELNPLIESTNPNAVTMDKRAEFEEIAERLVKAGAKAFGEMTALHYSFRAGHPFEQMDADHPLFRFLSDVAARHDIPIDLHIEAVPRDQPTPLWLHRRSSENPDVTRASLPAFERLLAHNRKTRIVWQHVGWDNTGHMTPALVRQMLKTHGNLYCSVHEDEIFDRRMAEAGQPDNRIHDSALRPRPDWVELMREFPDRFMVGADEFIRPPGMGGPGGPSGGFVKTWSIIRQLPADLRERVGRDNAARVYRLGK